MNLRRRLGRPTMVTSVNSQGFRISQKRQVKDNRKREAQHDQKYPAFPVEYKTLTNCKRNGRYENSHRRKVTCKNRGIIEMLRAARNKTNADRQKK